MSRWGFAPGRRFASRRALAATLSVTALVAPCVLIGTAAAAPKPVTKCHVTEPRLGELSGLAADERYWYAEPDSEPTARVYVLDHHCHLRAVRSAPVHPDDAEDLALAGDGTLWLADTGDNDTRRATVALDELRPNATSATHRLRYPDGPHDAEALVLGHGGVPYLFTKSPVGESGVYAPARPLATPGPTPLRRVAELSLDPTNTPGGPVGSIGSVLVTGAAISPDRRVLAVRTYTDAYLYPIRNGNVVAALRREPTRVPLRGENQGEAVAFTPDGTLLSSGEGHDQPMRAVPHAEGFVHEQARAPSSRTASAARSGSTPREGARGAAASARSAATGGGLPTVPAILVTLGVVAAIWGTLRWLRKPRRR